MTCLQPVCSLWSLLSVGKNLTADEMLVWMMSNFGLLTTSQNIRLMLGLCQHDPQRDWVLTCEGKCVMRTENDTTVSLWNPQRAQTQPWCCSTAVATPVTSPPRTWAAMSAGLPSPELSAHWGLKADTGKNHPCSFTGGTAHHGTKLNWTQ